MSERLTDAGDNPVGWRCCGCGAPPPFLCACVTQVAWRNDNDNSWKLGGDSARKEDVMKASIKDIMAREPSQFLFPTSAGTGMSDHEIEKLCHDLMAHHFEDAIGIIRQLQADITALRADSASLAASLQGEVQYAETLIKALAFYADVSDYHAPLTGGMGKLWLDCGETARAAINTIEPKP